MGPAAQVFVHHVWGPCPCPAAPDLGAGDEGDADGQLALHAPAQEPAPGAPLVLQTEDVQHLLDFLRALVARQAFQLQQQGTEKGQGLLTLVQQAT